MKHPIIDQMVYLENMYTRLLNHTGLKLPQLILNEANLHLFSLVIFFLVPLSNSTASGVKSSR